MINSENIRGGRAEYTFKCGWIDWSHAGGNPNDGDDQTRDDIRLLWRQFERAPLKEGGGFFVTYEPVVDAYTASTITSRVTAEGYDTVGQARRYLVRHSSDRERYKRIALQIYQAGCRFAESLQQESVLNEISGSAFSFEDYVSNLLAFYRHMEGWNKDRILRICGGFVRDRDRAAISEIILHAMEQAGIDQRTIRARNWYQAYLVNDLAALALRTFPVPVHGGPYASVRMWVDLPAELRSIQPPPAGEHWYWRHPNADLERRYPQSLPASQRR